MAAPLERKAVETKPRVGLAIFRHQLRNHLSQRWPVLETMTGAAAYQPDIRLRRMPVDDEIAVGSLLVLANAALDERRSLHPGETKAEIVASDP